MKDKNIDNMKSEIKKVIENIDGNLGEGILVVEFVYGAIRRFVHELGGRFMSEKL